MQPKRRIRGLTVLLAAILALSLAIPSHAAPVATNEDAILSATDPASSSRQPESADIQSETAVARATGDKVTQDGVEYSENADGTLTLSNGNGLTVASLAIPATINGKSVTAIGKDAFAGAAIATLKSVTIPESVTTIGEGAFAAAVNLTTATLNEGLTSIGKGAFAGCSSLTAITIPGSVMTIGDEAFHGCMRLGALSFVTGATTGRTIGEDAFRDCSSLEKVTIPAGFSLLGNGTFYQCISLKSVELPSTLAGVPKWCFENCWSLTDISLAEGIEVIGEGAFSLCKVLTEVSFPESTRRIEKYIFSNANNIERIDLPDRLEYLGPPAFYFSKVKELVIPESVTELSDDAFQDIKTECSLTLGGKLAQSKSDFFGFLPTSFPDVYFRGTIEEWEAFSRNDAAFCSALTIHCSDGIVEPNWNFREDSSWILPLQNFREHLPGFHIDPKRGICATADFVNRGTQPLQLTVQMMATDGTKLESPDNQSLEIQLHSRRKYALKAEGFGASGIVPQCTAVIGATNHEFALPAVPIADVDRGVPVSVTVSDLQPKDGDTIRVTIKPKVGAAQFTLISKNSNDAAASIDDSTSMTRVPLVATDEWVNAQKPDSLSSSDTSNASSEWSYDVTVSGKVGTHVPLILEGAYDEQHFPYLYQTTTFSGVIADLVITEPNADTTPITVTLNGPSGSAVSGMPAQIVASFDTDVQPSGIEWTIQPATTLTTKSPDQKTLSFTPSEGTQEVRVTCTATVGERTGTAIATIPVEAETPSNLEVRLTGDTSATIQTPVAVTATFSEAVAPDNITWTVSPTTTPKQESADKKTLTIIPAAAGTVTVTCSAKAGAKTGSAQHQITVTSSAQPNPPEQELTVQLAGPDKVTVGVEFTLTASFSQPDVTFPVMWTCPSDMLTMTSDDRRSITMTSPTSGIFEVKVSATVDGQTIQATKSITAIDPSGISIFGPDMLLTSQTGGYKVLLADDVPPEAITWSLQSKGGRLAESADKIWATVLPSVAETMTLSVQITKGGQTKTATQTILIKEKSDVLIAGPSSLLEGETGTYTLSFPTGATVRDITWHLEALPGNTIQVSADQRSATIEGKHADTMTIVASATIDGIRDSATKTVKVEKDDRIILTGPSSITTGNTGTYTLSVPSGASVSNIVWSLKGLSINKMEVSKDRRSATISTGYADTMTLSVTVTVNGQTRAISKTIQVRENAASLLGPSSIMAGKNASYSLSIPAGDSVSNIVWSLRALSVNKMQVSSDRRTATISTMYPDTMTLSVTLVRNGKSESLTKTVQVTPASTASPTPTFPATVPTSSVPSSAPTSSTTASSKPSASSKPTASASAKPSASMSASSKPSPEPHPTIMPDRDSQMYIVDEGNDFTLKGIPMSTEENPTTVTHVLSEIPVPEGSRVEIVDREGKVCEPDIFAATGQVVRMIDAQGHVTQTATIIIPGDVLGTGRMDLSQVVRLAQAYRGDVELDGPCQKAGDWTNNGAITLTDLVRQAQAYAEACLGQQ